MPPFQEPRKTRIKLIYEGVNISRDIAPFLLDFSYEDKASGEADDLQITMEDSESVWIDPWFPNKGDRVQAWIISDNWERPDESKTLYCGSFEIDEVSCSGAPLLVRIKATSVPRSTSMRSENKSKSWEGYTLSRIARDIAENGGMELQYLTSVDPQYVVTNQVQTPDTKYLMGLCEDAGLALKVSDNKIIIFDVEEYEGHSPAATIVRGSDRIISYDFTTKIAGTYKAARAKYSDSQQNVTHEALIYEDEDDDDDANGQTLEINEYVNSDAEAETLAANRLKEANKDETTGNVTLAGDLGIVGGVTIAVSGFGNFDGAYFVESAKHSVSGGGGYTTAITLHEGRQSKKTKKGTKTSTPVEHQSLL